jgi:predicted type IV restriction endonuclease
MTAPTRIIELVERFSESIEAFRSGAYKEAHVRQEFLDPMFECLGWDMSNVANIAESYKDVVHEDALRIGNRIKAPDYSFRIGGVRKFFVEAKKPLVNIESDIEPAYQLKRYAWTAKLPLSIVTDFEEFAVYDCRAQPAQADKATKGRVLYLKYTDYVSQWEKIAELFSKAAVQAGSLDQYAAQLKAKRGSATVDSAFLAEIEEWRDALARNIALRNTSLTQPELNFAVQQIIDRIVFLRICEDRGIEPHGRLLTLNNGTNVYQRLTQLFQQADDKYNSGLFHFRRESGRDTAPDTLSTGLEIDDKPLKDIFRRLYYPESPYEFSVFPADILGQVYEQFLGKIIRLTSGHRAVVEEKPEVKKAGGVYYTPTYIVDHIVKQTIGVLCTGKTPKQIESLRIVDPACGSGSFLIGAYQYLLDWHLSWYVAQDPKKFAKGKNAVLHQGAGGEWRLTTSERKRILLNNIHGVDIDAQAVEVTKLSLLLKVLEGENEETINSQLTLFAERALPDLEENIRCGNSLIGPDIYQEEQISLLDDAHQQRINVFSWESAFPKIFKGPNPGFDVVIGNPPYINIRTMQEWAPVEVEYYKKRYSSAGKGSYDIYVVFVEKGLGLLRKGGRLGYILPSKFFSTDYGEPLRRLLSERRSLQGIVDFRHEQVFSGATTYTALLFLSADSSSQVTYRAVSPPTALQHGDSAAMSIDAETLTGEPWQFGSSAAKAVMDKLRAAGTPLIELPTRIARGSSTGADEVFVLVKDGEQLQTRDGRTVEVESEILRTPLYASDFGRYRFTPEARERVIFPYEVGTEGYSLIPEGVLRKKFPKAHAYLSSRRSELEERKQYAEWHSFSAPRNLDVHDQAQMVVPLLAERGSYANLPDNRRAYCLMASGGFSLSLAPGSAISPRFVLGLLNSKLLFWYLRQISNVFRGGWVTCTKQYVGTIPIRTLDLTKPAERALHDRVVVAVEGLLDLQLKRSSAKTPPEQANLQSRLAAAEHQLDTLVYELYGLSAEDVSATTEA